MSSSSVGASAAYVAADAVVSAAFAAADTTLRLADTVQVLATSTGAVAFNAALGRVGTLAMVATVASTVTFTNMVSGQSCTVISTQNATAGTLVFANTFFAGGTEPTVSSGSGAVDVYTIILIGTQLYGFVAGQDMKT